MIPTSVIQTPNNTRNKVYFSQPRKIKREASFTISKSISDTTEDIIVEPKEINNSLGNTMPKRNKSMNEMKIIPGGSNFT